jgi:formylglycine-generating enzyme required for sulfatase activity
MYKRRLTTFLLFLISCSCDANNLQIGAVTVSSSGGNQYLNFSIGWENSWRVNNGPTNWDAVWVFVKRRDCAALQWRHVNLASQDSAHTAGTPLFVDAYSDKKGVMIYRNSLGSGNINNVAIKLRIDSTVIGNYDYEVFGIEMVYVPEGSFYAGDGISNGSFQVYSTGAPFLITTDTATIVSPSGNNLWTPSSGSGSGGTLSSSYPKGFNSFYCMKYEISQGQYADFLNGITQDAATNRYNPSYLNANRFTISGLWPALTAITPNRACNWLGFKDLLAYLDWSALSPMTELEFEKVCRGGNGNSAVAGEYSWGSTTVADADSIITGTDGLANEASGSVIDTGTGLANYGNDYVLGPLRCGFAANNATNRFQAGASYYGVMELSGNLFELCYNVYFTDLSRGYLFNGTHGDGELSIAPSAGFANQLWPVESGSQDATEFLSATARGGAWSSLNQNELRVSDRTYPGYYAAASILDVNTRANCFGGRGISRRQ